MCAEALNDVQRVNGRVAMWAFAAAVAAEAASGRSVVDLRHTKILACAAAIVVCSA